MLPPAIKVLMGQYNGFECLEPRIAGNAYDAWNNDYFSLVMKLKEVTDDYLNDKLEGSLPGIRGRASLLFEGGNLNPSSINCCNVKCSITGKSCVLMRCEALSSKRSVIHTIHAVFENTENGDFMPSPLSTCSCEDGSLFCSHMVAFLVMISVW